MHYATTIYKRICLNSQLFALSTFCHTPRLTVCLSFSIPMCLHHHTDPDRESQRRALSLSTTPFESENLLPRWSWTWRKGIQNWDFPQHNVHNVKRRSNTARSPAIVELVFVSAAMAGQLRTTLVDFHVSSATQQRNQMREGTGLLPV